MTEIKLAFSGCGSQKNNFDALCYNDLGFYDCWYNSYAEKGTEGRAISSHLFKYS